MGAVRPPVCWLERACHMTRRPTPDIPLWQLLLWSLALGGALRLLFDPFPGVQSYLVWIACFLQGVLLIVVGGLVVSLFRKGTDKSEDQV